MRVTVIGHSCLRVETRAGTILVDPWLFGSCYWRSWWHFPPSQEPDEEMLRPDWIYFTHHHFDSHIQKLTVGHDVEAFPVDLDDAGRSQRRDRDSSSTDQIL